MGFLDKITKKKATKTAPAPKKKAEAKPEVTEPPAKKDVEKAAEPAVRGPLAREGAGNAHRLLVRPHHTEKADRMQAHGKYVFIVDTAANKTEIAKAIRDLYGVKPVSVRVIKEKGRLVRFGRTSGKQKDEKKAIITLKPGDSITVTEG